MSLGLEQVAAALRRDAVTDPPRNHDRRLAAVAMILRFEHGDAEVLLMRRAEHEADPWSGQVSLPGGRQDPGDPDLAATVARETLEEIGLDLGRQCRPLGRIPHTQATAGGRLLPLDIHPFVFALREEPRLTLGAEAAAVFWLPLAEAARGSLDGIRIWRRGDVHVELPCWRYEGEEIWGLTRRMLLDLLGILAQFGGGPS